MATPRQQPALPEFREEPSTGCSAATGSTGPISNHHKNEKSLRQNLSYLQISLCHFRHSEMARHCGVFPADTSLMCHIRHNNSTWPNLKTFPGKPAKPLRKVLYNIRQESHLVGIIVALYETNCLGTSVSIPKKDSCSLVCAATGPLSPGRRFFIPRATQFLSYKRRDSPPQRDNLKSSRFFSLNFLVRQKINRQLSYCCNYHLIQTTNATYS